VSLAVIHGLERSVDAITQKRELLVPGCQVRLAGRLRVKRPGNRVGVDGGVELVDVGAKHVALAPAPERSEARDLRIAVPRRYCTRAILQDLRSRRGQPRRPSHISQSRPFLFNDLR